MAAQNQYDRQESKQRAFTKSRLLRFASACLAVIAIAGFSYIIWEQYHIYKAQQLVQGTDVPDNPVDQVGEELPDNPIDFSNLWESNVESYAWLYIPSAEINVPVQQSAIDDAFYLDHDQNRNPNPLGCAFTQLANSQDFTDPVTVIYGHNVDSVFGNLHYFEDGQFFNDNQTMYIYIPGHILTYSIIAANEYDSRHILNSFDFSRESVRTEYFKTLLNPSSLASNVRDGVELNSDSKIVQLSTCTPTFRDATKRYIVSAVLVDDQETK